MLHQDEKATNVRQHSAALLAPDEKVTALLALILGSLAFIWSTLIWYRYHPHMPWRDMAVILSGLQDIAALDSFQEQFPKWFELHYMTHRIAVIRFLAYLEFTFFSGYNHIFAFFGWMLSFFICGLFLRLLIRQSEALHYLVFFVGLMLLWFFSPAHIWNLINPVNVSWHLTFGFALTAIYLLVAAVREPTPVTWCTVYLLATLAAFSTFGGVVAWLLLPVIALVVQPRAVLPALVISCVMSWAYCSGLMTDESVIRGWAMTQEQEAAGLREQVLAGLASNAPLELAKRTLVLLSWPLSDPSPVIGSIIALISLIFLAIAFLRSLAGQWGQRVRLNPLLEFSLFTAGLCLAMALATQLGRQLVQPNYLMGPSYERFQTISVIYWIAVSSLAIAWSPRYRGVICVCLLLLALVLQQPQGSYLKQEVQSAELAAEKFDEGLLAYAHNTFPRPGNVFNAERYPFAFDSFYRDREVSYAHPDAQVEAIAAAKACSTRLVSLFKRSGTNRQKIIGLKTEPISLVLTDGLGVWSRSIFLLSKGKLVGVLSTVHQGDYSPSALLLTSNNRWQGYIVADVTSPVTVVLSQPWGHRALCTLTL